MNVHVRLYGTLGKEFPDHDPLAGFETEISENATLGDLIDRLGIPKSKIGLVTVQGSLAKVDHPLTHGDDVRIYRPVFGG